MRGLSFVYMAFIILLLHMPMPVMAKDIIIVDSKIVAATVYSDRANVIRTAKVKVPSGSHNLVFTGIPIGVYTDSFRAEGESNANLILGAISHKRKSHLDYVVPKEKELNKQLVNLQDKRKLYTIEKQALQAGKTFLENIGKQAVRRVNEDIAEIDLKPETWSVASDSITLKMLENLKNSHSLDIKIREINEQIDKVESELRQLRTGQKQSYDVTIPFESDKETVLTIYLSYQLPNAGWQPIYDARLDIETEKLELVQYGFVWQRTGEDWNDIELTLSTSRPNRGTSLPKLYTNWISLIKPQVEMKAVHFSAMSSVADSVNYESDTGVKLAAPRKAKFKTAQINTEGFVGEYKIIGLSNVKSDGTKSKLMIGTFDTENSLQVHVKPQLSTDAYLVVKAKLKGDAPILAGQVNLFRDGAYIGKAHIPMLHPNDMEELAFGIDDNIRVKRNILKDKNSETGLISKENIIERHFVTEIKNLHKKPVNIMVFETIPVSKDENIRVEILKDKTSAGYESDVNNIRGLLAWQQELKAQEELKVMLGWKVTYPKGEDISGI